MKTKLLGLALAVLSSTATAAPFALPNGPIYFQFTNLEQVDTRTVGTTPVNNTATCAGCSGSEGNWGVAQLSVMRAGVPFSGGFGTAPGALNNDIGSAGTVPFFADQLSPTPGNQVTAIFYGVQQTSISTSGTVVSLKSTGGFIDLYYDDPTRVGYTGVAIGSATPAVRTSNNTAGGFTDGTFLVRLAFASGIDPTNATTYIQGTIDTSLANNSGSADSYANVVDVNGDGVINSADGLWAGQLNSDWFGTVFGTRDIRFSNKIDTNTSWNGAPGVLGETSNDPGRAFVSTPVAEPGSLALVGLALFGLGLSSRRRRG